MKTLPTIRPTKPQYSLEKKVWRQWSASSLVIFDSRTQVSVIVAVVVKLKVTVSVINFAHLCLFLYFRSSEKHLNLFLVQVPRWQVSDICLACFHILSLSNVSNCVQGYTILINSSKEVKRNLEFAPFFSTEKAECEPGERQCSVLLLLLFAKNKTKRSQKSVFARDSQLLSDYNFL